MTYGFVISEQEEHRPLALAQLENRSTPPYKQKPLGLKITRYEPDYNPEALAAGQTVSLIDVDNDLTMEGKILLREEGRLEIAPGKMLGPETRRNLRVRTAFESLMFPVEGNNWQGQQKFISHDLSSGGIALRSTLPLHCGEIIELVLPLLEPPLLVQAKVLRPLPSNYPEQLYAARFYNLTDDEDSLIRKSVFAVQLRPNR